MQQLLIGFIVLLLAVFAHQGSFLWLLPASAILGLNAAIVDEKLKQSA